jgi:hypothetical protein
MPPERQEGKERRDSQNRYCSDHHFLLLPLLLQSHWDPYPATARAKNTDNECGIDN